VKKIRIFLAGATGSIGRQTLEIARKFPEKFEIVGFSVFSKIEKLAEIVAKFPVKSVQIFDGKSATKFQKKFPKIEVFSGTRGEIEILKNCDFDLLLNSIVGAAGVAPTICAAKMGKKIALANKESLVCRGEEIQKIAAKTGAQILPVDSEHSAIWQSLRGNFRHPRTFCHPRESGDPVGENFSSADSRLRGNDKYNNLTPGISTKFVRKIWLTCSGGPFADAKKFPATKFKKMKPADALAHPNWKMGAKISIDSATLMNKAFELIEAVRLFEIPPEKVEVVLHRQSILHSAVEFTDGNFVGVFGAPKMEHAISVALFYPDRAPSNSAGFSLFGKNLTFEKIDETRFPSLKFARRALKLGENFCEKMCRANDAAVADFLAEKISFADIFKKVAAVFPEEN